MGWIVNIKTSLNFPSVFEFKLHCNVRGHSCELLSRNSPFFKKIDVKLHHTLAAQPLLYLCSIQHPHVNYSFI